MRRWTRWLSAAAAMGVCWLLAAGPAYAAPSPNREEWWFPAWGIQDKIWPITKGQGVTVALIDSGVNARLPDLAGVVLPGKNYAGGDGRTDTDDEANSHGHGSSMAITIAGQGGPHSWLGIAPAVKILPLVDRDTGDWAPAIRYAVDNGAKVINISRGAPAEGYPGLCPDDVQQAVAYAADHNVVVVASAGNEGEAGNPIEYPASCAGVLAVGATGPDSQPWAQTERQPYVAVAAPGFQVGLIGSDGVLYHNSYGTSESAAFTSAAAALIFAKHPGMSAHEVVQRLIASALPVEGLSVPNPSTGYGIIRITRALNNPVPADAPNPVYDALATWKAGQQSESATTPPPADPGTLAQPSSPDSWQIGLLRGLGIAAAVITVLLVSAVVAARRRGRRQ